MARKPKLFSITHLPPPPLNKKELRRFFGIEKYLGKFSPSLAESISALRQLLAKKGEWVWRRNKVNKFEELTLKMWSMPVLQAFSLEAEKMISTDASSYGLRAAVLHI